MTGELAITLHILGFLASQRGHALTSETLARAYGTSPVVLRRVLAKLQHAGLVVTRRGAHGGSVLARPAKDINLRQAYEALQAKPQILTRHPTACHELIPVVVGEFINDQFADAEEALLKRLEAVSVDRMDKAVRARLRQASNAVSPQIERRKSHQGNPKCH
ncbi:MAG: Rrf2 family transcriptional regulator [Planctomycetota bacterium]